MKYVILDYLQFDNSSSDLPHDQYQLVVGMFSPETQDKTNFITLMQANLP